MPNAKPFLFAAAAVLVLGLSGAGTARAESLAEAVALAYETNPTIQANRAQLRAVDETYVQARSGFGPQLNAQIDLRYNEIRTHADGSAQDQGAATTFSLDQPVFSSGRLSAGLDAARAEVLAARERLRQAEADLMQRVIAAYVAVRRDEQILAVVRSSVEAFEQRLEEVEARVEVGENTRTDLAQAQARLAGARSDVAGAEAGLASSRAVYLAIVGRNPATLDPEPPLPPLPEEVDQAFDAGEAANHLLLAAKYDEQASRSRIAEARSRFGPSVNLRVQGARAPAQFHNADVYVNSVVAQAVVSQPLFASGLNASRVRRTTELNTADRLEIDATRRTVLQEIAQQWGQLAAARAALAFDQITIEASELAYFGMREEERFGLRSTIELLNAQLELSNAQVSFLRNRYQAYTSHAAVLNRMGALDVEALAPGVEAYDPEDHFDRVKNRWALPTEWVVRAVDSIVVPPIGPPLPAREVIEPNQQPPLPLEPPPAAETPPLRPVSEIVTEPPGSAPTPALNPRP